MGTDEPISNRELILAVAGDSPRSRRARANLQHALDALDSDIEPREIDVLVTPEQSLIYGMLATPALIHVSDGVTSSVLYGDLSDESHLRHFLNEFVGRD